MNFWQHILSYFIRETDRGEAPAPTSPPVASAARTGAMPLYVYGGQTAMCVATVFRCVKLLSESIANLPLQYQKRQDDIFRAANDPRMEYLLNVQPDFALNAFDFWRQVGEEMILDGNAYILPVYNPVNLQLERLALCGRGTVSHDTINDTYDITDEENGIFGRYEESEIIHIKGLTLRSSKRGVSVLTYARQSMDIAATGDKETQNRFANGGNVRGIVSNDKSVRGFGEYQDIELSKTAESIDNRFRGGERIVGLPGQVAFSPISLSSTDMQFLESRKFTVIEICRFFSVPPSFVYADTSNNYKSVEQADVDFLSHTLNPMLRNIEIELRRKLIAPELSHKYRFKFDRSELFACDLNGMMDYRTKLLQLGATINEVRRMFDLPPVEGGEVALVSANLRGINEVGEQPEQQDASTKNNTNNDK